MDVTFTREEWEELMSDWNAWGDESYVHHAAYILRDAIERGNYDPRASAEDSE